MAEADEQRFTAVVTDEILVAITEALNQYSAMVTKVADYAESKGDEGNLSVNKTLYWSGYVAGLRDAAQMALETRPLRGVK